MVLEAQTQTQQEIFNLLFEKDEITWQDLIYDLIKTEQMNPWDINIALIAEKFIETLGKMKQMDFRLSGKIILAAAFFLKIKSDKLLKEDMDVLNNLINPDNSENIMDLLDEIPNKLEIPSEKPVLTYRTPQPRKRKVSVYDLVEALEKALEQDTKRFYRKKLSEAKKVNIPKKERDMTLIINDVYKKIKKTLQKVEVVFFSQIISTESKEDKITVFVPLLYLDTQRKIDLEQKEHFGDISINLTPLKKDYAPTE